MLADHAKPTLDFSKLEDLSYDECLALLSTAKVGRLAFVESGDPVVLPVNFTMDGSMIVFRTGVRSGLFAAVTNGPVRLEIDHWDDASRTGWSVLVKGVAEHVTGIDTERFEGLSIANEADETALPCWVRISIEEISGRKLPTT